MQVNITQRRKYIINEIQQINQIEYFQFMNDITTNCSTPI